MVFTISSAKFPRPLLRKAPAIRPAILLCPPSSSFRNTPETSCMVASAARASVAWLEKYCGEHWIRADSSENARSPSMFCRSSGAGSEARRSSSDVPCGRVVILLRALGERTTSCLGTVQFPPCRDRDCSGERDQFLPKRVSRYTAAKRQKEAYHAVLSPFTSWGRLGTYQPLITSRRKPFASSRSRWVRLRSRARTAAARLAFWSRCRISRDCASFSEGFAIAEF